MISQKLYIYTMLTVEAFDILLIKSDLCYFHFLLNIDLKDLSGSSNRDDVWEGGMLSLGNLIKNQNLLCLCSFWGVKKPFLYFQRGAHVPLHLPICQQINFVMIDLALPSGGVPGISLGKQQHLEMVKWSHQTLHFFPI